MPNHRFTIILITVALAFAAAGEAQSNRTFVSTTGSDSNNCGPTTPCRTFAAALAVTNPGGELVVLTSGGYGAFTINQAVTITAIGVDASITETLDANALTINTTGNVTINGLSIYGEGTGNTGIFVQQVGFLRLYNVTADSFVNYGVYFPGGNLAVYDSSFNDNNFGLWVRGGGAYVQGTTFDHNAAGVFQDGGSMVVVDSHAQYDEYGFDSFGGNLSLIRDESVLNNTGVLALGPVSTVQLSYCLIAQNSEFAYAIEDGVTISGSSPGTNTILGDTVGSLSTATTLQ